VVAATIGGGGSCKGVGAANTGVATLRRLRGEGAFFAALEGCTRGFSRAGGGGGRSVTLNAVRLDRPGGAIRTLRPTINPAPSAKTITMAETADAVRWAGVALV
jgi:hypothetical protein